ncbi:MAG TPA: hypothetical protein PK874_09850 [Desulfobacteraceae bacterium]|nr:hypothetical protein [Desulfobacteraceae bacterium]
MREEKPVEFSLLGCSAISKRQKKTILVACCAALLVVIASMIVQFIYLPLGVDGGLYSYSGVSLSRGGDPGESQLSVEELETVEGVKATWDYDLSRTIRVIPVSWWFRVFGANIWTVKVLGLIETLLLFGIMYVALQRASRDREIALLLWAVYVSDAIVLTLSTELRPDIMITILTLIVFMFVNTEPEENKNHIPIFFLALLCMFLLPVIHITAAISLSFLICYMLTKLILDWRSIKWFQKSLYALLIFTGILGFLIRRGICAALVPSQYLDRIGSNTVVDVEQSVFNLMSGGVLPLIEKEFSRWASYFYPYNLPLLFVAILAVFLFVINIVGPSGKKPSPSQISIVIGCAGALGVLALDPHPWNSHALVIVPFTIIFLANEIKLTSAIKRKYVVMSLLLILVVLSAASHAVRAGRIIAKSTQTGFSNQAVLDLMRNIFNEKKQYLVVGPASLWPYIDPKVNVTIFDAKIGKMDDLSRYMERIDYFFKDKDYKGYEWEKYFRERYPDVILQTVAEIGQEDSGWPFVKVMRPALQR